MDDEFNRLASAFGQIQHPTAPGQSYVPPQQQVPPALYGQQVTHGALPHHLPPQHYLNSNASNEQIYNVQPQLQQTAGRSQGLPDYSQQLLQQQTGTSQPNRPADFLAMQMGDPGMQLHAQQPQTSHQMYTPNVVDHFQSQYHQMPQTYQQQANAHQLYLQQQTQQQLYMQQQQQNYLQQRQAVASLQPPPPSPALQHSAFLQPQLSAQQSPLQAQQPPHLAAPHLQRPPLQQMQQPAIQERAPGVMTAQPQSSTSPAKRPITSPSTRHRSPTRTTETATMRAAERAAALVEENARILQQREEEAERESREQARRENEQIQSELERNRREADDFSVAMQERLDSIPESLHLGTCHTLTKVGNLLPLPSECASTSDLLPIYQPYPDLAQQNVDSDMAQYLAAVLNSCMGELSDIELKHEDGELNDLELDEMTPLCRAIHDVDANALNVELLDSDLLLFDSHIERVVEEELKGGFQPSAVNQENLNSYQQPQTSAVLPGTPSEHPKTEEEEKAQLQLRRQVVSVGKQPKAAQPRKKKDMVDSLYDSLTVYFDPSTSQRRRGEENNENKHSIDGASSLHRSRKRQKLENSAANRSPTPEDVIHQRELEWLEQQRLREEKLRRRQEHAATHELWSNDVMAENDSLVQFSMSVEKLLEQVDEAIDSTTPDDFLLVDRGLLSLLCIEAQKLKCFRKFHTVQPDRLMRLLNVLERCIREVVNEEGMNLPIPDVDDESDDALRELVDERLCRAADAAYLSLLIMTAPKMPKQLMIEDLIERAILLCKEFCQAILFPAFDLSVKSAANISGKSKKTVENPRKRKLNEKSASPLAKFLYQRTCEMMGNLAELARFQNLTETTLLNLCSLGSPVFFVDGTSEMQIEGIRLLSTVFSRVPAVRRSILQELLESLHRLPSSKNHRNCFRLSETQWISNFAVLMLQLVQSVVKVPSKRKNEVLDELDDVHLDDITVEEQAVVESYQEAQSLAVLFFSGFLGKCTAKSEDDYRRLFDQFLQDLLTALYRPVWPVAELMLTVLGNVLVKKFRSKSEMSLRIACLDYLGTISARLRKDRVQARQNDRNRLDMIVKCIVSDEQDEQMENVDISNFSISDKIQKLEQALIDYVITKNADDVAVEYTIHFYVAEWYRETLTDMEIAKERHRQFVENGQPTDSEVRKEERRLQKLLDRGEKMKSSILRLVDKKYLKRRTQYIAKTGNTILDSDAIWAVKYLASKREFSQSFEHYLKQITFGVSNETSVNVRTKAMRCLTQIIEADNRVLLFQDVHKAVNGRMTDPNISVREATAELIGKYVVSRPDLIDTYFNVLIQRIMDTGVAVRKRIIRILRDIVERQPDYPKNPEIVARIIRRTADEDGVRKLVVETMYNLWFVPAPDFETLSSRITLMADAVHETIKLGFVEFLKQLFASILKEYADRPNLEEACRQIVDALVDRVLQLDQEMANAEATNNVDSATGELFSESVNVKRVIQQRLVASLTMLSVFSNVKAGLLIRHAEVLVPYLAIKPTTQTESQVLVAILQMLERIVPLVEHPSDKFLQSLDGRIDELLSSQSSALIISSSVACSGAIYNAFPKFCPKLFGRLAKFLDFLRMTKMQSIDKSFEQKALTMLRKVMFSVGVVCRYFDVDAVMERWTTEKSVVAMRESIKMFGSLDETQPGPLRRKVLGIFGHFCASTNSQLRLMSLSSLGQVTAECPEYLLDEKIKKIFIDSLKDRQVSILSQVLSNLNLLLIAAEERAHKSNEKFRELREGDLKEMELGNSGLSSSIMQHYWPHVMHAYFHPSDDVRQEAANVIFQTQSQGLLTPGSAIPTLIAMCTDRIPAIRNRIETLVKEIDSKYAGMVSSKAINGVRQSFMLQKCIRQEQTDLIRGIRSVDPRPKNDLPTMSNEVQSVLQGLYTCIRTNRQQRRNFLGSMLRLFSDKTREKVTLEEWVFIGDNLAHFPYQLLDEPLYVIYTANQIISISGQNIMGSFRQLQTSQHVPGEDDDEFAPNVIYSRMPDDKTAVYQLKTESHACYLLMALKSYIMRMYNFKEDKVQEYSPSESAKIYDKPATRRNIGIFSPQSVFDEFKKNPAVYNTIEDHINLAHHFSAFFNKLLSLEEEDPSDDAIKTTQEDVDTSDTLIE